VAVLPGHLLPRPGVCLVTLSNRAPPAPGARSARNPRGQALATKFMRASSQSPVISAHQLGNCANCSGRFARNAFIKKIFAGLNPAVAGLEDFSRRFPFTTKEDCRGPTRPRLTAATSLIRGSYTRFHQTSGTSSAPLAGWIRRRVGVGCWKMEGSLSRAGVRGRPGLFCVFIRPFIGFWLAFEARNSLQCLCLPGGSLGSGAVGALCETKATVALPALPYMRPAMAKWPGGKNNLRDSASPHHRGRRSGGSIPRPPKAGTTLAGRGFFDHHGMTDNRPVSTNAPPNRGC